MSSLRRAGVAFACASVAALALLLTTRRSPAQGGEVLFDGTLAGWEGDPALWRVEDGCIVGSTVDHPIARNTFLIWRGGELADFELSFAVRLRGNNSGVQYRSQRHGTTGFVVGGYQCDVNPDPRWFGMLYEEGGRAVLATHGMTVAIGADGGRRLLGAGADAGTPDLGQWQSMRIVARGPVLQHWVGGKLAIEVRDEATVAARRGILALQLHAGEPMTVWFKDLLLRRLPADAGAQSGMATSPLPQWIWDASNTDVEERFFRRGFALPAVPSKAMLAVTCDNHCRVEINGTAVTSSDNWAVPRIVDVTANLRAGDNVVAVHGWNDGYEAGLCAELIWTLADGSRGSLVTDGAWRVGDDDPDGWNAPAFDDTRWPMAAVLAPLGGGPWADSLPSDAFVDLHPELLLRPVPAIDVEVPDTHRATRLLRLPRELGSWVSLTRDPQGRFYASDQTRGLYRLTAGAGGDAPLQIERVDVDLDGCQGLCWSHDALYAVANGDHSGLYRLTDSDGDDRLDRVELLQALVGRGEHGPHGVVAAPDGERLLVICGNHTQLPPLARSRVPRDWRQDAMPPRIEDPGGQAIGIDAPGGFVCSVDRAGRDWELICCGLRNAYDLAVLGNGEVFTFDSDMEWDMGLPWYRPTRILQVHSGVDYGWRGGSAKWSADLPDTLPAVVDVGPASPTGMIELAGGLLALDWTFGIAYRIALEPAGASYRGVATPVARGKPLPLADAIADASGFGCFLITGGRGLPTSMLQLEPTGDLAGAERLRVPLPPGLAQRRALEAFHGRADAGALAVAWPVLGDDDPVLRAAARIAVEWQPVGSWRERALAAAPQGGWQALTALLALARRSGTRDLQPILAALAQFDVPSLSLAQRLAWLRIHQLALLRAGPLPPAAADVLAARLLPMLPSGEPRLDGELCALLAALDAEGLAAIAVPLLSPLLPATPPPWAHLAERSQAYGNAIAAMLGAMPPTGQLAIANALRTLRRGWTIELRRAYFAFLQAARRCQGGSSYGGYLQAMFDAAWSLCSDAERTALADIHPDPEVPSVPVAMTPPAGPGRHWQLDEAVAVVRRGLEGRDPRAGHNLFHVLGCVACHRFQGEGGGSGPDLTGLQGKFGPADVVEAIVDPNKVVSDQYLGMILTKKNGARLFGRVASKFVDGRQVYEVVSATADGARVQVPAEEVDKIDQARVSPMPAGLADRLNEDELRDLVAWLLSGGR